MKLQSRRMLAAAALAVLAVASRGVARARDGAPTVHQRTSAGAPMPLSQPRGPMPFRGAAWVPGYWAMQVDHTYLWVAGRWERPRSARVTAPPVRALARPPAPSAVPVVVAVPVPVPVPVAPPILAVVPAPAVVAVVPAPAILAVVPPPPEYMGSIRRRTVPVEPAIAVGVPSAMEKTRTPMVFIWSDPTGTFHLMAVSRATATAFQGRITSGKGIAVVRTIGDDSGDRVVARQNTIVFELHTTGAKGLAFTPGAGNCVNIDLRHDARGRRPPIMLGAGNVPAPAGNLQLCREAEQLVSSAVE